MLRKGIVRAFDRLVDRTSGSQKDTEKLKERIIAINGSRLGPEFLHITSKYFDSIFEDSDRIQVNIEISQILSIVYDRHQLGLVSSFISQVSEPCPYRYRTVLYVYCTVLYHTVLYYTVPYCAVSHSHCIAIV
jgi:hypothetical protein